MTISWLLHCSVIMQDVTMGVTEVQGTQGLSVVFLTTAQLPQNNKFAK